MHAAHTLNPKTPNRSSLFESTAQLHPVRGGGDEVLTSVGGGGAGGVLQFVPDGMFCP